MTLRAKNEKETGRKMPFFGHPSMRCAGVVAKTHPGLSLALVQGPAPSSMGQNHLPLIRSFISAATVAGVWVVWVMWAVRAHYVPEKH